MVPPPNPRSAVRYERRPQLHRNTDASVATFRVFQGLSSSGIRDATCRDLMLRSDAPKASKSLAVADTLADSRIRRFADSRIHRFADSQIRRFADSQIRRLYMHQNLGSVKSANLRIYEFNVLVYLRTS